MKTRARVASCQPEVLLRELSEAGLTGGICSVTSPAGSWVDSWSELRCDPCCVNGEGSRIKACLLMSFRIYSYIILFKALVEVMACR